MFVFEQGGGDKWVSDLRRGDKMCVVLWTLFAYFPFVYCICIYTGYDAMGLICDMKFKCWGLFSCEATLTYSWNSLKYETFSFFVPFHTHGGEIRPFHKDWIQTIQNCPFSAQSEEKSLWDAANHELHAVWKWFLMPSAASLQRLCRFRSNSAASAWKIQNRQLNQNSL